MSVEMVMTSNSLILDFPGGAVVKRPPTKQETQVPSLGWEDPLEKEMATHSNILAQKILGQRSLEGYTPWGCKKLDKTDNTHISYLN